MKNQPNLLVRTLVPVSCFVVNNNNVEYKVTGIQPYQVYVDDKGNKKVADVSRFKKIDLVDETIFFNNNYANLILSDTPIVKRNVATNKDKKVDYCVANEFFLVTNEASELKSETTYLLYAPAELIGYFEDKSEIDVNEFTKEVSSEIRINVSAIAKGSTLIKKTTLSYFANPVNEIDELKAKPYKDIQTKLSELGVTLNLDEVLVIKTNLSEIFG